MLHHWDRAEGGTDVLYSTWEMEIRVNSVLSLLPETFSRKENFVQMPQP